MLSSFPLLVIFGGITSIIVTKMAYRGQNAYAKAADVVEQTISSIRTVCYILSKHHSLFFWIICFVMTETNRQARNTNSVEIAHGLQTMC